MEPCLAMEMVHHYETERGREGDWEGLGWAAVGGATGGEEGGGELWQGWKN